MIDNARISITDKCNLHCWYCSPSKGKQSYCQKEQLTYQEMLRMVRIFSRLGIKKIKITGGEPLLFDGLSALIKKMREEEGIEELSLTTNGVFLSQHVKSFKKAGLNRINISLNSLRKEVYFQITKKDFFNEAYHGIRDALALGFDLIKVNVIPMRGINDNEIFDFIDFSLRNPLIVRFIELFSTTEKANYHKRFLISTKEIKERILSQYTYFEEVRDVLGDGPARYFKMGETQKVIGFISNDSENFCEACSRIRMDSKGQIFPCLFASPMAHVKDLIKEGKEDNEIFDIVQNILAKKGLFNKNSKRRETFEMSQIGG